MSTEKDQVRKDIQTYENQGKVNALSRLGTLASLGAMAHGGFTGNKKSLIAGGIGAVGTGYLSGHASQKRRRALSRIKKYYDLRDRKFLDVSAVLPSQESIKKVAFEKKAIVSETLNLISSGLHHMMPSIPVFSHALDTGFSALMPHSPDIASLAARATELGTSLAAMPYLGNKFVVKPGFEFAKVLAKQHSGKALTSVEKHMLGKVLQTQSKLEIANEMAKVPWSDMMHYTNAKLINEGVGSAVGGLASRVMSPLRRYFYPTMEAGSTTGAVLGEAAGKLLKQVGTVSPKYQDLGIDAITSDVARQKLMDTATADIATLQKGVEAAKTTRLSKILKALGRGSAPSMKQLATDIIEHPEKLEEMVGSYKKFEDKTVAAGKAVGIGGLLALTAGGLGSYRTWRHPLSKNELPQKIINS